MMIFFFKKKIYNSLLSKQKKIIQRRWDEAQLIVIKMTLKQLTLPTSNPF